MSLRRLVSTPVVCLVRAGRRGSELRGMGCVCLWRVVVVEVVLVGAGLVEVELKVVVELEVAVRVVVEVLVVVELEVAVRVVMEEEEVEWLRFV